MCHRKNADWRADAGLHASPEETAGFVARLTPPTGPLKPDLVRTAAPSRLSLVPPWRELPWALVRLSQLASAPRLLPISVASAPSPSPPLPPSLSMVAQDWSR